MKIEQVKQSVKNGLSVLIRFHDIGALTFLEQAVFSLCGQHYGPIYPIVLTQGFSKDQLKEIAGALDKYTELLDGKIQLLNYPTEDLNEDCRSKLLNMGLNNIDTRYFAILDFDDIMYPNGYSTLISRLEKSSTAIAFGRILLSDVNSIGGVPYTAKKWQAWSGKTKYDLFIDNFCPIHSFVIDRSLVQLSDLYFDETMHALEDYHFLLRIVAKYSSDFCAISKDVGEYRQRQSHTIQEANTTIGDARSGETVLSMARRKISELKRDLNTDINLSHVETLREYWSGIGPYRPEAWIQNQELKNKVYRLERQSKDAEAAIAGILHNAVRIGIKPIDLGCVDSANVINGMAYVTGWALDKKTRKAPKLICVIGSEGDVGILNGGIARPDVCDALNIENIQCGFEGVVSSKPNQPVRVVAFCQGEWRWIQQTIKSISENETVSCRVNVG